MNASPDTTSLQLEGPAMFDVQLLATTVAMTVGFVSALPPRQILGHLRKLHAKLARHPAGRVQSLARVQGRRMP